MSDTAKTTPEPPAAGAGSPPPAPPGPGPVAAASEAKAPLTRRRFGCLQVSLFVAIAVVLTALVSFLVFRGMLFPSRFKPVRLSASEAQALDAKLERLDFEAPTPAPTHNPDGTLVPEAYTEAGAERTVRFAEKELNALLARNTDLADKVAFDLSQDLVSARVLLPLDEDLPILGGRTLRVKAGLSFSFAEGRPVVMLRGVSVMGVPVPNAWLGGLKNVDLVQKVGADAGFWKAFAAGVEAVRVEDGALTIRLKE